MKKFLTGIRKNYFDNTVALSKLSKTFLLWAFSLALVYITNVYLTKLIGLDLYGKYTVFISWVSLASMLLTFGWDGYLVQKIPQLLGNEESKSTGKYLLQRAVFTFLGLFILLSVLLILAEYRGKIFSGFFKPGQLSLFLALVFLFSALALTKSFLRIFHIVTQVQWFEEVLKPLVLFGVILYFFYWNDSGLSLTGLYTINSLIFAALALVLAVLAWRVYKKNFTAGARNLVEEKWAKKCFYFMCIYLGYSIFSRMELLFLGYFEKNGEAAKFQILLRISDIVLIPDFLFNYFLPQKFSHAFAQGRSGDARELFRNSSKTILMLQLLCLAGVLGIGYFYLQSFNIASAEMYLLLGIMCTAPVFYSLFGSANLVLKTSGNERYSFYALLIVLLAEAAVNSMFIVQYGLKAAVVISWTSILIYTFLLSFFVHRKLNFYTAVTGVLFSGKAIQQHNK
ncbi:MAG TPA: lipopolysaccharide biosynthesis protein [Ferruginibacter sp.]|nr:lipopolysaccharide biosynthesis protein [Ferruginibacter sp.]